MRLPATCVVIAAGGLIAFGSSANAVSIRPLSGAREMCTRALNVAQAIQQAQRSCVNDSPALRVTTLSGMHTIVTDFTPDPILFTTHAEHLTDFDSFASGFYQWSVSVDVEFITSPGASAEAGAEAVVQFEADAGATMRFTSNLVSETTPDVVITMTTFDGLPIGQTVLGFGAGRESGEIAFPAPGMFEVKFDWTWNSGELPVGGFAFASGLHRVDWEFDPRPCPADLNADGAVGAPDLAFVLGAWGSPGGPADLTLDGVVNAGDLAFVLGSWGPCE